MINSLKLISLYLRSRFSFKILGAAAHDMQPNEAIWGRKNLTVMYIMILERNSLCNSLNNSNLR